MVSNSFYDTKRYDIPITKIKLAQHDTALKADVVALSDGPILTAVDPFKVRIFGKSGHVSRADLCVDPIETACHIFFRLQTIVNKEVSPKEFAVVGCASIHGESAPNINPEYVDVNLSIRTYRPEVRGRVLKSVKRVVHAECEASGSPQIKRPAFKNIMHVPPTINDPTTTAIVKDAFNRYFGHDSIPLDPFGASEDCSILSTSCGAPLVFTNYGCVDPEQWAKAVKEGKVNEIPQPHSAFFAPAIQPTLRTVVDAFAVSALTYLQG